MMKNPIRLSTRARRVFAAASLFCLVMAIANVDAAAQGITCAGCGVVYFQVASNACKAEVQVTSPSGTNTYYTASPGQSITIPCVNGSKFAFYKCNNSNGKYYQPIPIGGCVNTVSLPGGCCADVCLRNLEFCWYLQVQKSAGTCKVDNSCPEES